MQVSIIVDPTNTSEVEEAIAYLQGMIGVVAEEAEPEEDLALDLDDDAVEEEGEDMLDGLMDEEEEEPEFPTIEDMKNAFKFAVKKKGKDASADFVKKVLAKLKVSGMGKIAEDKRQSFIDIVKKFANK